MNEAGIAEAIGRRLPIGEDGKPAEWPSQPGDYVGPVYGYTGDKPAVFFLLPIARDEDAPPHARSVHHVTSPPHTFTEDADGLTISASILTRAAGDGAEIWHGYLEHGTWRQA